MAKDAGAYPELCRLKTTAADKGQSATRKDALVPNAPGGMAFGRCTRKGYAANSIGQDVQVPRRPWTAGSGEGAKAPRVAQSALRERACRTVERTVCARFLGLPRRLLQKQLTFRKKIE